MWFLELILILIFKNSKFVLFSLDDERNELLSAINDFDIVILHYKNVYFFSTQRGYAMGLSYSKVW